MEYTNSQIRELIKEYIHDAVDRKITYQRLVDGLTFERIAAEARLDIKTVRNHIHKCEEILFKHIPS